MVYCLIILSLKWQATVKQCTDMGCHKFDLSLTCHGSQWSYQQNGLNQDKLLITSNGCYRTSKNRWHKWTHRWTYLSSERYWSPYATSNAICVNPAGLTSSASLVFWPTIWRLDSRNVFKSPSNTRPINTHTTALQRIPCKMSDIIIISSSSSITTT